MGNSNNKSVLVSNEDIKSSKFKETKEISNSQVLSPLFFFSFNFFLRHCFFFFVGFLTFCFYRFPLGVEYLM